MVTSRLDLPVILQHFILQRLPNIPCLRSLCIPRIQETLRTVSDRIDLAFQVLDIVTLRPEIELCYLAIQQKCFKIYETKSPQNAKAPDSKDGPAAAIMWAQQAHEEDSDDESIHDYSDVDYEDDDVDENQADQGFPSANEHMLEKDIDDDTFSESSESDTDMKQEASFELRMIDFPDDVDIFKYGTPTL